MKSIIRISLIAGLACLGSGKLWAQKNSPTNNSPIKINDSLFRNFLNHVDFRQIGPATTSGRIVDIAVNPQNNSEYYIAAAYGGVWKTTNAGITFSPIFDKYGTQSIGCLAIDPQNPNIIWVGTGENNNQRSVGYGNGIYKSIDGGKSFSKMGLVLSEHIGMIKINPSNSKDIWVAAYGPLWKEGGERGIYHSVDAGKTWTRAFFVSDNTGCNEIHFDPTMSNVMYATFHQRRRHEWTYLGGGPESAIYKSEDNGLTWNKLNSGLPNGDLGRITMITTKKPGYIFCMIETSGDRGGVFASTDYGASWSKVNAIQTAGNYYQELIADPVNPSKFFIMDTYIKVTEDGGKSFKNLGESNKHVDNHALWIDPKNTEHFLVGCDGGLYETFNSGKEWDYKENISIAQFYRVSVDNALPFYNIYGGTQDNNSLGGPSRNNSANGVGNTDWFVTVGGDGFKSQIDPLDPNTVYSQWQYGGLIRFNKITGESVDIKPNIKFGEAPLRWNWDAPLIISKYDHNTLFFAANRVFMSTDRGNSWKVISADLSRQLDRNKFQIMGKVWGIDAVAKNQSTSIYGNITGLSEGDNGELFISTDDGAIYKMNYKNTATNNGLYSAELLSDKFSEGPQIKTDGSSYPFVSMVFKGKNKLYAVLDHHRFGDFKPYVYQSVDGGKSWVKITKGLPENGPVKCIFEDSKDADLLFVGTEFGLFVSINGGQSFMQWDGGLPPIAIKEIVQQEREDELVLATFGRGFAICDNYHLLRDYKNRLMDLSLTGIILQPKKVKLFIPSNPLGGSGNGYKGASRFMAPNPTSNAQWLVFYPYEKSTIESRRKKRESELSKNPEAFIYPAKDSIIAETNEIKSKYFAVVTDNKSGLDVAKWNINLSKGWNKIEWSLKYTIKKAVIEENPNAEPIWGPFVSNGNYRIRLECQSENRIDTLKLNGNGLLTVDYLFDQNTSHVIKRNENIQKMIQVQSEMILINHHLEMITKAQQALSNLSILGINDAIALSSEMKKEILKISVALNGQPALASKEFETEEGLNSRFSNSFYSTFDALEAPTKTHMDAILDVEIELKEIKNQIEKLKLNYNDYKNRHLTISSFPELPNLW